MSGAIGSLDRQVLPRWRSATDTAEVGELRSLRPAHVDARQLADLDDKELEWQTNPGIAVAAEFVAASLMSLAPERSTEAATYILGKGSEDSLIARLAYRGLDPPASNSGTPTQRDLDELRPFTKVAELKRLIRFDPRNALAWCDLALQYSILGQPSQAADSMSMALRLAPTNRFVLRSGARLWVHAGDIERAHRLLIPVTHASHDPWLMAAELAVASAGQRSPRSVKAGRSLLESRRVSEFNTTELASALATLELAAGEPKRARRLFAQALADPTENSLAQVEWASLRMKGLKVSDEALSQAGAHEARARMFSELQDWTQAVDEAWLWLLDQPFSEDAAAFGSCIAEMGALDFERAALIAKQGLQANPRSQILINNLAFAQLESGKTDLAETNLRSIPAPALDDHENGVTWRATEGLLAFRKGDRHGGRLRYQEAIEGARTLGHRERQAMAAIMLAREEWRLDGFDAIPFIRRAAELATGQNDALLELCLRLLLADAQPSSVKLKPGLPESGDAIHSSV
jgi:tetratricopeptide (TPR) repeat protein